MSDGYPDRSKQRMNDGLIGTAVSTAKNVQEFADSTKEQLSAAQTGTMGKFKWDTNLLDMLGSSLYGGLVGQHRKNIGKRAMERALFGIDFDIDSSSSIRFETKPGVDKGRDYNLTFTKKF
tara:strand:+ start:265 stop:627 length:363 start_codon:yes stop_codon:yes gene_type:complete